MQHLLVQTQLSNIVNGKFDISCDSGWQMTINRCREFLKLNPDIHIDIMGPTRKQLITDVELVNPDLWNAHGHDTDGDCRLTYVPHVIIPNALVTRYDFDWHGIQTELKLEEHKQDINKRYDAVYINDPMHLRAFKAMFHVVGGYQPKFYVHSHFIDTPECPKFPQEASLWLGQCEAALKADYNFWQCDSSMQEFFTSMGKWFTQDVVDDVRAKSMASDDGYSIAEITSPVDMSKLGFSPAIWHGYTKGKAVLFFPNRISPSSGDYTNGMKFMFEVLPELRKRRQDFTVVCGNPNLKFPNNELLQRCGQHGYVKLHDFTLNRDEYKWVAAHSDIVVGLYDKDAYGGTATRECIELGCVPLWLNLNEYANIAKQASYGHMLAKADFSDLLDKADNLIGLAGAPSAQAVLRSYNEHLKKVVRRQCSYEQTVPAMMKKMGLLP